MSHTNIKVYGTNWCSQRPHTETWGPVVHRKSVVVQPEHPMAQAARCGCCVGTVTIPAHASSMRRAIAQH
ncbi:MAG TPA: hypothetical protein VKB35_19170 [Ktedonobacteraceae bacterium]|nr:hypothetical protein [Ktedonobacteraceae bacterium]